MVELPSVTVEFKVNPVPVIVNVIAEAEPVTGFGETLLIVGAATAAVIVIDKAPEHTVLPLKVHTRT